MEEQKPATQQKLIDVVSHWGKASPQWKERTNALAAMVMNDMRPLNLVYGAGFKEFCKAMDSRYRLFNCSALQRNFAHCRYVLPTKGELKVAVHERALRQKQNLVGVFKQVGHISVTADCWSRYVPCLNCVTL